MRPRELTKVVALMNAQAGALAATAHLGGVVAAFSRRGIVGKVEFLAHDLFSTRAHQLLADIRSLKSRRDCRGRW